MAGAPKSGRSGRRGRIEPFNELGELLEHACIIVVGMLADEVDHLAIAAGRLSAVAARLVHHSEAVPTVVHVGEADAATFAHILICVGVITQKEQS